MKKSLMLFGAGLLSLTLLSACGKSEETKAADANTITMLAPYIETEPPSDDNEIIKGLEKYTGKEIDISWAPNTSYEDKMNITLASDDIPQVMVVQQKSGGFIKSAENGAFWDLTDYLKDYPNLSQANEDILRNSSVNGKVYGVFRKRDAMRTAVMVRQDWLDNLGLQIPKSIDDLYNLAKAFTENDPDGNGQNDTYGLIIPQWPGSINTNSPYDVLATWFGSGNAWVEQDGKLEPSFTQPEYLESIKYVKDMVDKGYVNKDFATLAADKWDEPFINGRGGIIIDTYSRAASISNKLTQAGEEDFVTFTGNLTDNEGQMNALPTDGYSGFLAIPKASVKTEKELKEVLTFLDKLNDEEAQILLNNGIEGTNFKVVDGMAEAIKGTTEADALNNAVKGYSQIGMNVTAEDKYYKAKPETETAMKSYEKRLSLMEADEEFAVYNPAASYNTQTYVTKGTQLNQIISDARVQYVAGQIDEKGWEDAVQLWHDQGGTQLVKETNELHEKE
ncbi:extracellular solute-binding protein [Enterococcus asini]|uniref:extracellular solute-binding protein n=1 Tax=Enterococcus asini TaxID=57732 RepID=UPI0026DCBDCD|nr:extracellular solute-binding protein [Enterococcus asini]